MLDKKVIYRGFTTIEVITIIAILSIITSIILPNFKITLDKYKIEIAARKLAKDLLYIQQKSICKKVKYYIIFDQINKDNYKITSGFNLKKIKLPPGVYIDWVNFDKKELGFSPTGAPEQGGTIALKSRSHTLYVVISVSTGRIRIGRVPPGMEGL